jgi:hypothetical protein
MYFGAASDPQPLATKDARRVDFTKLANDPDYPKLGRDDTYVAPEDSPPLYKRKRR